MVGAGWEPGIGGSAARVCGKTRRETGASYGQLAPGPPRRPRYNPALGALAQLGERRLCKAEVAGSIPARSTFAAKCRRVRWHNHAVESSPLLRTLTDADRPVIERLWQLYSHDMSEVRGTMPNSEGMYKPGRLPTYFGDPDRCGYLISYKDALAGFAFVRGLSNETRTMGDFFVVRAARRHHVGYETVRELFERHPGRWEIGFQSENRGAAEFWRRVVSDAVGTKWREELRPVPDKPDKKNIPPDHIMIFSV
jgi:predicted acetyltransferase